MVFVEHALDAVVDRRHAVRGGRHCDHRERNHRRRADRHGADIAEHLHAQREDAAIPVEQGRAVVLVARHVRGEELFGAVGAI